MDDPVKIIFRYKNNYRRIQYGLYVFIGEKSKGIMTILNKIKDKNLYDSLLELSDKEHKKIEKEYGEKWYNKFFNTYHIANTFYLLKTNSLNRSALEKKLGKEWYKKHVEEHDLVDKKILYSYSAMIKNELERKTIKKNKKVITDEDADISYKTKDKISVDDLYDRFSLKRAKRFPNGDVIVQKEADGKVQSGGGLQLEYGFGKFHPYQNLIGGDITQEDPEEYDEEVDDEYDYVNQQAKEKTETDNNEKKGDEDEGDEGDEEDDAYQGYDPSDVLPDEELDLEEIEKLYRDTDVIIDENASKTTELIKKALSDESLFQKTSNKMVDFDISKDDRQDEDYLKNVFIKKYVTNQYIFKDDTVKTIKNKICCSIKNNPKFGKNSFILPSRCYLWSEYYFDNKVEKVMVGQKWLRRNEVLDIDVEPNVNFSYYEELRHNLKSLRDNIKRYGSKIRLENDEFNILYDYDNYFTNNEIFMLDVYNELGKDYDPIPEELRNISDVYFRIYFPKIKSDDIRYILDYLNEKSNVEQGKIDMAYETINNDLIIENEVMKDVEEVKKHGGYSYLFKENYITQSVVHVNLRMKNKGDKLDLFRIFDQFEVNHKYPFIHYQTLDGLISYKFNEKEISDFLMKPESNEVLTKWFEGTTYGLSFKVRVTDKNADVEKFMPISLINDTGRIEYKTQWKAINMATVEDIKKTYDVLRNLLKKVNSEKNKMNVIVPQDQEFRYAFMNTIQGFILPEEFVINHNDLSEFSRYFFPYVALVIAPRKRQSKVQKESKTSKFGTYLRYKRVSKYENQARMEQRILYFMRNYEYTDKSLSNEISKQFNITEERAFEEIDRVRNKYPNIKKSRKVLKKLENIPKHKPPGIGIDIQGKQRDRYKIRISGARDKNQLDRIIEFLNILIFLYVETYHYKKPERQILKEKLEKLNKIAKRRYRVDDLVDYNREIKTVKQMTQIDKKRIGFKPEKGQNQWTRSCQNSGDDKKRRPQQYTNQTIENLLKKGYKFNAKTEMYERKIKKGKKEILLRAVPLKDFDEEGNLTGNDIIYACSPGENGEHMHIGFLTRSNNPSGHCMPCCFKKDPLTSKNKEKRNYFLRCVGQLEKPKETKSKVVGDKLYILQDTNKIQEGRYGFLPKYLDFYFNTMLGHTKNIKHHYLLNTKPGYYFKFGSKQDEYQFVNAIGSVYNLNVEEIKNILIKTMENDKSDQIFTSLNNGDVRTQFETRTAFIHYIKNSKYLDFEIINNILSIPGVIVSNGMNIIVFEKKSFVVSKNLEKDVIKEDFIIKCQNYENSYLINDPNRETIFMLKENKNYYPIVFVVKETEEAKTIKTTKKFKLNNEKNNIVNHIREFYFENCNEGILTKLQKDTNIIIAKKLMRILKDLPRDYQPRYQVIDARNKCKYVITFNSSIIPVKPSGALYNIQIIKNMDNQLSSFQKTVDYLTKISNISKEQIPCKPIGVYYDSKKNNEIDITAVITESYDSVPIVMEKKNIDDIYKMGFIVENKPLYDNIDKQIEMGKNNIIIDNRIKEVNEKKYEDETYQLFRLHFSEFINQEENERFKIKIEKIITDKKLSADDKRRLIRKIVFRLVDKDLFDMYEAKLGRPTRDMVIEDLMELEYLNEEKEQVGGKIDKLVHITNKLPNLINYDVNNNRDLCAINVDRDSCVNNKHCYWSHNKCYLTLTKEMAIKFVNKVSEDLVENSLSASELLKKDGYFVSDIVDFNKYTERENQKIIKSTNSTIKSILKDLFGEDNIPQIGKRRIGSKENGDIKMNINNPMKDLKEFYVQNIIENNNSYFRAYINGFFWINHPFYDPDSRNMGYYSFNQTSLANYLKSRVVDWLRDSKNKKEINEQVVPLMNINRTNPLDEFISRLTSDIITFTSGVVELYVLSRIIKIPIVVINDNNKVIFVFNNGLKFHHKQDNTDKLEQFNEFVNIENNKETIYLRFSYLTNRDVPDEIEVIYSK